MSVGKSSFYAATAALLIGVALQASAQTAAPTLTYPQTRRVDQVDDYHGQSVADPYRWLEDNTHPDLRNWITAQNDVTDRYLASIAGRAVLRERLTRVWNYATSTVPVRARSRYFYRTNTGLQNQSVLQVQDSRTAKPRVLLDPNLLSPDGTVSLGVTEPSPDGSLLAYAVSSGGSDWQEFRIRDVRSGRDMADTLRWAKFSGVAWTRDSKGFYYSRYDAPKEGEALTGVLRNQKLYFHLVGTPQKDDQLVLARPDQPDFGFDVETTYDGQFAVISIWKGTDTRNLIHFIDLAGAGVKRANYPVVRLIDEFVGSFEYVHSVVTDSYSRLYFRTDLEAPRGRIVAIDIDAPRVENWVTIVRETSDVLESATYMYDRLVLNYLSNASSLVRFVSARGTPLGTLPLPGLGTVRQMSGQPDIDEMFFDFTSYVNPTTIFSYSFARERIDTVFAPKVDVALDAFETQQTFATSKDGTRIPIFVTAKKGITRDGSHPTILYAYGGFNISMTPEFSPVTAAWLEMGGVYAVANLRGGGEFGSAWHRDGSLLKKQNGFDDFIAAAEHLIKTGYTSSARLAIQGGSNGGLLVGAVMTQRPELMAVALPQVGVLDMLRFQKFTIGWAWTSDYGSSDNAEQFRALFAYSPLHNVRAGTRYPATLVTTGDHDDRVVPAHSYKFIAALQAAHNGPAPVIIRIETRAGHGAGKPTSMRIDEATDRLAFAWVNMGMPAVR